MWGSRFARTLFVYSKCFSISARTSAISAAASSFSMPTIWVFTLAAKSPLSSST